MKVLEGVRVLELGSYITAPYAAMMLGELGADVIKVERPDGYDPFRTYAADSKTAPFFFAFNRNKRSVALDYTKPEGMAAFEKLVRSADVLLINVRPGVEKKLNIDAERLQKINPRLIYCSITGFGASGPYAKRPGYDNVGQTLSGWLSRYHQADDPRIAGPAITDSVTGLQACIGVLGALHERSRSGVGTRVEVNMLESMIAMAIEPLTHFLFKGEDQPLYYRAAASAAFILRCRDGKRIGLHMSSPDKFWHRLTQAIERPDLAERYPTSKSRLENYDEIASILAEVFITRDRDEWLPTLESHGVPFAPERSLSEVEQDEQVMHLGTFSSVDVQKYGTHRVPNRPQRYNGENASAFLPPPALGEHTSEVLEELGLKVEEITALRAGDII